MFKVNRMVFHNPCRFKIQLKGKDSAYSLASVSCSIDTILPLLFSHAVLVTLMSVEALVIEQCYPSYGELVAAPEVLKIFECYLFQPLIVELAVLYKQIFPRYSNT